MRASGDKLPPRRGGGQGFAKRKLRLFPIGVYNAGLSSYRPRESGPRNRQFWNDEGVSYCSFPEEMEKDGGGSVDRAQQPRARPTACRLANPIGTPFSAVNPHKFGAEKGGLRDNAQAEGTLFGRVPSQLGSVRNWTGGPFPLVGWGVASRPSQTAQVPVRRGSVERRCDEAAT